MCYVMSSDSWLWIMVECGLVHMWMCTSLCAYVCSHVCTHTCVPCMPPCMIAFKHTFAAMWVERSTLVGGWACEGVCILKSFCPHAHPQLHSASFLLTCVVYFPTVKYLPAALGNQPTSQQIVSTHKSKYYHFFGWHDGIQSHRVCSVWNNSIAHMRSCCAEQHGERWEWEQWDVCRIDIVWIRNNNTIDSIINTLHFFFTYLHQDDAIYSHNSQITFHQSTDRATEGGEASNKKIQDEVKQSRFPRHANTSRAPDRASPLYIPGCVKSPCRTPAIVCKTSRVEPIPQFQRMVGARREQRCWGGEGGRRQSGSVRSCLLIPELTASLCVRQTPQPRVAPPWRNVHTPLLHATDCTPSFAPSSWVLFVPGITHKRARALTQPHTRSCP